MTPVLPVRRLLVTALLGAAACTPDKGTGLQPDDCEPGTDGFQLAMNPGEVRVFTDPAVVSCIEIPESSSGSEYVFVAANNDAEIDRYFNYTIESSVGGAASAGVAASVAAAPALQADLSHDALTPALSFETALRAQERRLVDLDRSRRSWEARWSAPARSGAAFSLSTASASVAVGDLREHRVPDFDASNLCTTFFTVGARVKAVGQLVVIWQDTLAPANGFTTQDFTDIAAEYDALIHPTAVRYFGQPSDLDADGKVHILYTPEVNKLTDRGASGFIGGFFFGGDLVPRVGSDGKPLCTQSNEKELFYLLVPDPNGQFSDARTTATVRQGTRGTVSHEIQHMINAGVRLADPAVEALEEPWLSEALSHFAEEMTGRALRGYGDLQPLTINDVADASNNYRDFNAFFYQNLARFELFLAKPDTSAPISIRARDQLAPRGAGWALLRYAADHYANGDVASFTRRLVAGPEVSVANFVRQSAAPLDSILVGWMIANYADELGIAGLSERYSYPSWHMRGAEAAINDGIYPLLVRTLSGANQTVATRARSSSGNYFRRSSSGASPASVFRFLDAERRQLGFAGARLYILRVR